MLWWVMEWQQHDSDSWDKPNIIPVELLTPPGQYYWVGTALQG